MKHARGSRSVSLGRENERWPHASTIAQPFDLANFSRCLCLMVVLTDADSEKLQTHQRGVIRSNFCFRDCRIN